LALPQGVIITDLLKSESQTVAGNTRSGGIPASQPVFKNLF